MKTYQVNKEGYYGEFGGAYIPEILHRCVEELKNAYSKVLESEGFKKEFHQLLHDYVGRPSPLYLANRLSEQYGCKIYLKREDLNHTGAHKINNAIGQVLLAKRMGKKRIIAETGAGQHGVATATVCALMNMQCIVYMGKTDVERQHINVEKMKMLGAEVRPVTSGNMTLKDATNEAIRDWCCHPADTYYVIGSTVYYTTDGTCYQYNVSGLTPGRQYKVYISYDSTRYYITGGLKVQGLGSEELTTIENENTVQ